jgi:CRP-like cAMP-binding protein
MTPFLLHAALKNFVDFSNEEITILQKAVQIRQCKKKEVILNFGEKEKYVSCVAKGLVRKHIMCGVSSISTEFAAEGGVICSNSSIGSQVPSEYCIEAIEPTTLISITLDSINWLYTQSPVFFEFSKALISQSLLKCEEREIMLMKYDATGRFKHFMETKANLFLRLPQTMIASYLNIQPETFSKLKRQLSLEACTSQ